MSTLAHKVLTSAKVSHVFWHFINRLRSCTEMRAKSRVDWNAHWSRQRASAAFHVSSVNARLSCIETHSHMHVRSALRYCYSERAAHVYRCLSERSASFWDPDAHHTVVHMTHKHLCRYRALYQDFKAKPHMVHCFSEWITSSRVCEIACVSAELHNMGYCDIATLDFVHNSFQWSLLMLSCFVSLLTKIH